MCCEPFDDVSNGLQIDDIERPNATDPGDVVVEVEGAGWCQTDNHCRLGEDMYCERLVFPGLNADGGFADYLLTGERAVVPLPAGVDPVDIAPHADAGVTAYHAGKKAVRELNPGNYAVVVGVGGLGHIGLQMLDAMSAARVVAVDIKDEALELADGLGADHSVFRGSAARRRRVDRGLSGGGRVCTRAGARSRRDRMPFRQRRLRTESRPRPFRA